MIYRFRWKDAQALLDQWLGENPDDTLALLLKAKLVEQQLNHDGAIAIYRKILDLDPEQQEARLLRVASHWPTTGGRGGGRTGYSSTSTS